MKRLRELFESIAYAGMKPGSAPAARSPRRWLGPLSEPVNRFLDGPGSNDPFYLSNRTTGQKFRVAILIVIPLSLVLGGVGLAAMGFFDASRLPAQSKPLTSSEMAAKMLPNLKQDMQLDTNREVQVLDVIVVAGRISGSVKNSTAHPVNDTMVDFDLTDGRGSRVGAVTCRIARIEANGTAPFQSDIPQTNAVYALVREIRSQ